MSEGDHKCHAPVKSITNVPSLVWLTTASWLSFKAHQSKILSGINVGRYRAQSGSNHVAYVERNRWSAEGSAKWIWVDRDAVKAETESLRSVAVLLCSNS